jgi:hypothetical protein
MRQNRNIGSSNGRLTIHILRQVQGSRHSNVEVSLAILRLFEDHKPAIALSLRIGRCDSLGVTSLKTDRRSQSQSGEEDAGDDLETHFGECRGS